MMTGLAVLSCCMPQDSLCPRGFGKHGAPTKKLGEYKTTDFYLYISDSPTSIKKRSSG